MIIEKTYIEHTKPYCVLSVLDTESGRMIANEMLSAYSKYYDVHIVKHDGSEYEYPGIYYTRKLCLETKESVLYIHTKGAGNHIPRNPQNYINSKILSYSGATMDVWQETVRKMWEHEFITKQTLYFSKINNSTEPLIVCPFTGPDKSTWNNGFIMTYNAALKIKEIKKSTDRYFFEHMFKNEQVKVVGTVYRDLTPQTMWKMQSYIWQFANDRYSPIVSFTTYKQRVKYAVQVIDSIVKQTIVPFKICLTLYNEDITYITPELQKYIDDGVVELLVSDIDIAPHKKYYYVMQKYPTHPVITIDDDVVYDSDLVQSLLSAYLSNETVVSARRVHEMKYQQNGKPLPYSKWNYECKSKPFMPSFDIYATGIGGVLYPPNILQIENITIDDIMDCLYADDVFLKKMENDLDIKVQWVKSSRLVPGTSINASEVQNMGLALTNNLKNRNDVYIEQIGLCKKETVKVQNKRVIYTCITGNYEALVPLTNRQSDFDYVCFTDNSGLTSDFWELRPVPQELLKLSCVKQQRIIKICPHRYLPDYDESIWIDGAVDVLSDPNKFIEKFCSDSNKSVFIRKHPSRNCIYTEGLTCIKLRKDKAEIVNPQLDKYRKENFPRNFGLAETNIIYRKHKNPYCVKLMDLWAIELLNGSHRDQLSFNYALWKTGSDGFKYLETNLVRGTYFKWYSSHNRRAITSSEKKKSVSIPVSSNLSVAKKNQGKKTVIVNNRTRRYAPIQTSKKNEKRVTVSSKRYGTSKNIAAQQISRVFGIPLHGSKSSYKPIKVETVRNTVKFKTVKQVNIVERKVIDAPKQTKVKFKPTVRNNWKKFETSNTPKQIKITSKPIVKPNIQKNKTGETPKPMPRVNPIVFKIPTDLVMSGLGGRYVPPVEIKIQKKVEKSKKATPVVTQTNETTKSKPVNATVSSPTKVKENKQSQVILKQDTRVLSRRVDNISRKKIEMNNKRKMSKKGGFFR